ncbi:NHL repeat-containing protein [Spirosoma validum]|uniref:NHL repeat-containing protein n=1 Tax=Spirosoma validum TaxID=2771355 RepID=A0A927B448_9BACT|nr:NHL repeat-containing protein [Spirosoma validum]MBD2755285.1 NHL repeat-containing protein [Spirosoma validum]
MTLFTSTKRAVPLGLGLVLWLYCSSLTLAQVITTVAGGNGYGAAPTQLSLPYGVWLDAAGNLYVGDYSNNRVQKFPPNANSATPGVTVAGGNGQGAGATQLVQPSGIFVDGAGNLYVADSFNNRVQKFPPNANSATPGVTVAGGNGRGAAATQLDYPQCVFVDGAGYLFVSDFYNHRVLKYPPNSNSATPGVTVAGGNGQGAAPTQLNQPVGVFVDGAGNLLVSDYVNNRVQKFPPNSTQASTGVTVAANQLNQPVGVFVDGAGNLAVCSFSQVLVYPPNSTSATAGVVVAGGNGQALTSPAGIFVDAQSNLFVVERFNYRVQKYAYPPLITSQPEAGPAVCAGSSVTAQVGAISTYPGLSLSYRWYSSSGPLSGQTSPTLSVTGRPDLSYYVMVTSSNGLSTSSEGFSPLVLPRPTVRLVASGPLSAANPSVTLTASGAATYQFSPGASQVGNGPTATVTSPGPYLVIGAGANGCFNTASVTVDQLLGPDLTPLLYARPTIVNATTPVSVVVDLVELNGVATSGPLSLKISQQAGLSLSLPASATSVGGRPVSNSAWSLSGPSGGYYTLSSQQVISGGGLLSVGLTGRFSGVGSTGSLAISGTLVGGSGGEQKATNNTDADRLEYFQP